MPLVLLVAELLNDCEWTKIVVSGLQFYSAHSSSTNELILALAWRVLVLIPLILFELPLIIGGIFVSFEEIGFIVGLDLKLLVTL